MQVYGHHCRQQLPEDARRLREAATYIVENQEAVHWGLEICGFQAVQVRSHSHHRTIAQMQDHLELFQMRFAHGLSVTQL